MGESLPAGLRAADILLLRSPGPSAWAVRLFDGAEVDRAALFLGAGRVAEVEGDAVVFRSLEECLAGTERAVVRRMKEPAAMEPVLGRAEALRDAHVTGRPEVLLALLSSSRRLRPTPSLRLLQRSILEAGAAALAQPAPMTSAQFVWRCYEDALPEASDVYTVRLNELHNLEVVSGIPMVPGAGVARRLGRGVHPESLLAWAAQPLVRSRLGSTTRSSAVPPLDEALARYQLEVRDGAPALQPGRAEGGELLASLQIFALAFGGAHPALARSKLPAPLEMLFRSAADLCTAGDLLRSDDLFTLE
jgi:hypothetical protein